MMRGVLRRSGKNSRPNLRSCLSALLRRQSKLTKAAEADTAHARIVCQKPVSLRGRRQRGHREAYFQLCVAKFILPHAEKKTDAGLVQQRTPLDRDLIVRVYAPAQVIRVFRPSRRLGRLAKIRVATLECPSARKITFIPPYAAARHTAPHKTHLYTNETKKRGPPTTATTPRCTLRHGS